jgi:CHAT domain-containing protein/Tfp pilus assembly protein PilF
LSFKRYILTIVVTLIAVVPLPSLAEETLEQLSQVVSEAYEAGDYSRAADFAKRAHDLSRSRLGEQHPSTLASLGDVALLYRHQGRYDLAEAMSEKVLALQTEVLGEKHPDTLISLNNLALLYQDQGRYDLAEPMYEKVLALMTEVLGEKHPSTLTSLNNLALLYQNQDRYDLAEPMYEKALAFKTEVLGEKHPDTLISLNNLALLYQDQGRYDLAEPMYEKALALQTEVLGEKHPSTLNSLSNLALLQIEIGNVASAFTLWQTYLRYSNDFLQDVIWGASEATRQSYLKAQVNFRNNYISLMVALNTEKSAKEALFFSLTRKGLLLHIAAQSSAITKASDDPAVARLAFELNKSKKKLSYLTDTALDENTAKLFKQVTQQIEKLEKDLGRRIAGLGRAQQQVLPDDVVDALTSQQGLLDFHTYTQDSRDKLVAIWVDPSSKVQVKLIPLGDLAPIAAAISDYRKALNSFDEIDAQDSSREIYSLLWKPIESFVDSKEVFVIPDGILHLLPFAALLDEQGQPLVNKVKLSHIVSARELVLKPYEGKQGPAAIFSAPLYDPEQVSSYSSDEPISRSVTTRANRSDLYFGPLKGALVEGQVVAGTFAKFEQKYKSYALETATENRIATTVSPRFLHIATHGFFLEPPQGTDKTVQHPLLRSGLAFANANVNLNNAEESTQDGILTALEALSLRLEGTDLVVLSACETGVGDINTGEGVYGLQRAFIEAGAKAVLYTLWEIDDEATAYFMAVFYEHFMGGVNSQEALRLTQLDMLNQPKWNFPYYWAGFVLSGSS